jgi:hypothetical protein
MEDKKLVDSLSTFKDEIVHEFRHQMSIQREDFQHKLDLVAEGHQMLAETLERTRVELKEDFQGIGQSVARVEVKMDSLSINLAAHRADTEAHHGVYRVKES